MSNDTDRREWMITAARWTALGTIGAVTAGLGWRAVQQGCINRGRCKKCPQLTAGCELPDAEEMRAKMKKRSL